MRSPGGDQDERALSDFLINQGDALSIIGEDRYNVDAYYACGKHGAISTKHSYIIDDLDYAKWSGDRHNEIIKGKPPTSSRRPDTTPRI